MSIYNWYIIEIYCDSWTKKKYLQKKEKNIKKHWKKEIELNVGIDVVVTKQRCYLLK